MSMQASTCLLVLTGSPRWFPRLRSVGGQAGSGQWPCHRACGALGPRHVRVHGDRPWHKWPRGLRVPDHD